MSLEGAIVVQESVLIKALRNLLISLVGIRRNLPICFDLSEEFGGEATAGGRLPIRSQIVTRGGFQQIIAHRPFVDSLADRVAVAGTFEFHAAGVVADAADWRSVRWYFSARAFSAAGTRFL